MSSVAMLVGCSGKAGGKVWVSSDARNVSCLTSGCVCLSCLKCKRKLACIKATY